MKIITLFVIYDIYNVLENIGSVSKIISVAPLFLAIECGMVRKS